MFLYRRAISSRQIRIFVAVFAAIGAHAGLIALNPAGKSTFAPLVELPRSVNVIFGQARVPQPPAGKADTVLKKKPAEKKAPVQEKQPETNIAADESFVKEPQKTVPATLEPVGHKVPAKEFPDEEVLKTHEEAAAVLPPGKSQPEVFDQEVDRFSGPQEVQSENDSDPFLQDEGVPQPGTLQLAYPRYQLNAPPPYPGRARKRGQEGTVILLVLVNREGGVEDLDIDVSSNFALLDRAAVAAVKKWSFEPGRRGQERVPMRVRVPVTFKLTQ